MASVKKPDHDRAPHFLRAWRDHVGLSQEKAAEAIGMSRPNLSKIENGEVPYEQDMLERLAVLYGCMPADLLATDPADAPAVSFFDLEIGEKRRVQDFINGIRSARKIG